MTGADVSARVAWADDAVAIAAVQVRAWRTSYADLLPAEVLEALDAEEMAAGWADALNRPGDARHQPLRRPVRAPLRRAATARRPDG